MNPRSNPSEGMYPAESRYQLVFRNESGHETISKTTYDIYEDAVRVAAELNTSSTKGQWTVEELW